MCKVLLRNDYWCKGLGFTQPKSEAYQRYRELTHKNKKSKIETQKQEMLLFGNAAE